MATAKTLGLLIPLRRDPTFDVHPARVIAAEAEMPRTAGAGDRATAIKRMTAMLNNCRDSVVRPMLTSRGDCVQILKSDLRQMTQDWNRSPVHTL